MTSFLKKLQLLKKKSPEREEAISETNRDARTIGPLPTSSADPASQRTSQLLPLLIKPTLQSPGLSDVKKKAQPQPQPQPQPLVLPELVPRQPAKPSPAASQRPPPESTKMGVTLPKLPSKSKADSSPIHKKRSLTDAVPKLPDLSDERFKYLWEKKTLQQGKTAQEIVAMMDEREVLGTILEQLQLSPATAEPRQIRTKLSAFWSEENSTKAAGQSMQDKASLFKYYGIKLRDSQHKDLVREYVYMLLGLPKQEEAEREGISEAVGLIAACHLPEILLALQSYGHVAATKKSLQVEPTPQPTSHPGSQVRLTLILCYGHAAMGAKPEQMLPLVETIVSELLFYFRINPKDEIFKKTFMRTVLMISKALQDSNNEDVHFPHKSELVICIIEVIEEEPLGSFSIAVLHQAMITVSCMTPLKPPLTLEVKSDLVAKSVKKVFSLPSLKMTKLKAGSPMHPTQTQDFYQQTINACNNMLTSLLSESPNMEALQDILIHTNGWIESQKTYERERAVRSTSHLLKFVSQHLDFDLTQEFSLLGHLVALLALRTVDSTKDIGLQAAEAMYHLHYITMSRMVKEMEKKHKNKKGNVVKWFREDFFIPGPAVFFNNISKVAKAFGEHLSTSQITDLALKAIDNLTHEEKALSQAAGKLLSSFLEECGMDVEDLPMIIKELYNRLPNVHDPETREQALRALCTLASKRLNKVVDTLLECSVQCDDTVAELWKALVSDQYSNLKIVRPLLKRLLDEDPLSETCNRRSSKSLMPLAATSALCLILSLPEAGEVIQGKFPHLLIALVTQVYFVLGSERRGSKRSNSADAPGVASPVSCAVQALKNLIACAGYMKEYNILGMQGCWDMLSNPDCYFEGIFHLVRTLFTFNKVHLKTTFKQANAYLHRPDVKERTVGMAFFTELLFHSEIGLMFVKQDILDVLQQWMVQDCPLMQMFGVRGLGYLLHHPLEDESLEPLLSPLISCAFDPDKNIAKESIKSLQKMFQHLDVEDYGYLGIKLIPHILKYFSDEENDMRCCSIGLFGTLLKGVKELNKHTVREDVFRSTVPLLIQLGDPWTKEVSHEVLATCADFLKWGDVPKEVFEIDSHVNLYYKYFSICKYLMRKHKSKLPEMLTQMLEYLKSRNASSREAAAILIGCSAVYMKPDVVTLKELEEVYLALRELQGDCEDFVANAAAEAIEHLFKHCWNQLDRRSVSSQQQLG